MHKTVVSVGLALGLGLAVLAGPARADIKSFNAAMQKGDYKAAAAEAASTWPTLNKSRDDLAIIAREVGFAAYLAGDFAAAKTYGEAAVAGSNALGEEPILRAGSEVLLRLAEHRLSPSDGTRDVLFSVVEARSSEPSLDLISFFAMDAVTAFDFQKGAWDKAAASAALGERITRNGGGEYATMHYRLAQHAVAANYMAKQNREAHLKLAGLERRLIEAIANAPTLEDADALLPHYYEAGAWEGMARSHLSNYMRVKDWAAYDADWKAYRETEVFKAGLARINRHKTPNACSLQLTSQSEMPDVPVDSRFRDMVGIVVLRLDISATGRSSNPRVVAVAPGKEFGEAILKGFPAMSFKARKDASPGCSMAQKGYVLSMIFHIDY
jgi:hypothetical protein